MMNKNFPLYAMKSMWLIMMLMIIPSIYCLKFNSQILLEWSLVSCVTTPINMTLIIDSTSTLYSAVVMLISANVLSFSMTYMKDDKFINRFTMLVLAFILSMNFLIFIPHLMVLLIGWDGLGITSFILVIYYQNYKSLSAGLVTALTNRIGDVAILLSIAWTLSQGHWNMMHMTTEGMYSLYQVAAITLAAMTKSAQMPFSSWLPAAMAAPTPVSALVHSSTLVTAGVFLLIRFYPFVSSVHFFNTFMLFIAVTTMIMAGMSATTECDMKKIIALSTLSQLGMMMTSIGLGYPHLAFIHMVIHALFKALLFICAGNMINMHSHSQDLRWMGSSLVSMPVTSTSMMTANLALCGFPFMSGFYSKDMIIEMAMFSEQNMFMSILIMLSVGYTSFYSIRFLMMTMWGPRTHKPHSCSMESSEVIKPMVTMSTLSIVSGSAMIWLMPNMSSSCDLPVAMKMLPTIMMMTGVIIGWTSSKYSTKKSAWLYMNFPHYASCSMWFLVPMSTQMIIKGPMKISHSYLKLVDQAWLEKISGQGMSSSINNILLWAKNMPHTPNSYLLMSIITMMFLMPATTMMT